jgi:transcriptional regulator with XRE-family HTH domain
MISGGRAAWFERLDERRRRERLSMPALATRLGLSSPQTIYNWRTSHTRPSQQAVKAIAQYLGENESDLQVEISMALGHGQDELVAGVIARRMNAQFHRTHLRDIRAFMGLTGDEGQSPEVEGIDLLVPRLRQRLPDCMISVLTSWRGRRVKIPYEYLVHVQADPTDPAPAAVGREELQERVLRAVAGMRGPTWWERSTELLPTAWDPAGVTLIYPKLLETRAPDLVDHRYESIDGTADLFVLSVYHGGALDVGALLADCLGFGYNTITNLAAQLGSWTMNPLRGSREIETQTHLARAITMWQSPVAGPFVWSINDPQPILDEAVRDNLIRHPGRRVVFLELSREALDYAAWQVAAVASLPHAPAAQGVNEYRELLSKQQAGLAKIAADLDYHHTSSKLVVRVLIDLPGDARQRPDGSYPDAEDSLFDHWAEAALEVRRWLDQFTPDGQQAPTEERLRQLVRKDDLLGPLVHGPRPATSSGQSP